MNATTMLYRESLYRHSQASSMPALPAGVYLIHMHDVDGETLLQDVTSGQYWDPNSSYPCAGEWRKDGSIVSYDELCDGSVAELIETVYLNTEDAETLSVD